MIAQLSGVLAYKNAGEVIVDVGGVGYQLLIPLNVFYDLPEVGGAVSFPVHTHVREDAIQLFGFKDQRQKQVFLLLTGVGGIGPRLGVNILSGISANDLVAALRDGDQGRLVAIPGVGKKLAERMIVELKDRLVTVAPGATETRLTEPVPALFDDAVSALVNLGYRKGDAETQVRSVMKNGSSKLEDILKESLRRMGS